VIILISYVGDLDGKEGGYVDWTEWWRRIIKRKKERPRPAGLL